MEKDKVVTLKGLIDGFDTKAYDEIIDNLEREIDNIELGYPRYNGMPKHHNKGDVVPRSQVSAEIKKLKNSKKTYETLRSELRNMLSQLQNSADNLENLVEQDFLLDQLNKLIDKRDFYGLEETTISKDNSGKYSKLHSKSTKKIQHAMHKMSKDVYNLICKNMSKRVHKSMYSIKEAISDTFRRSFKSKYELENKFKHDFHDQHMGFPLPKHMSDLSVDVEQLENAIRQIKAELNPDSLTFNGQDALGKLENIKKAKQMKIDVKSGKSKLVSAEKKYIELVELSRETWYLNEILQAFEATSIVQTEMYTGLKELVNEQEIAMRKLAISADRLYEKTDLQHKIDLIEQLEELYNKLNELELEMEQIKKTGNERQLEAFKQEYYNARYEMIKVLKDNPDLNNSKYNIDIKKIITKEKELYEAEIKKGLAQEEPVMNKTNTVKDIPVAAATKEKNTISEKKHIEETANLETDTNLQTLRTYHYQNYMREKVLNSELGKIAFSAYLLAVAPGLTQLIKIEKEREEKARNIYKDYLKYYSSFENKKDALSFTEFAESIYGMDNADVPIEYAEEYNGMSRK